MIDICGAIGTLEEEEDEFLFGISTQSYLQFQSQGVALPGTKGSARGSGIGKLIIGVGSSLVGIGVRVVGFGLVLWCGLTALRWTIGFLSSEVSTIAGKVGELDTASQALAA